MKYSGSFSAASGFKTATCNANGGNASAPVDSSGNYRIEGAPTGTVRLSARTGQGFGGGGKTSPVKSVQVDPGSSVQADLEFKTTTISGRVTQNGQPMSNAIVRFMPRNAQAQTTSVQLFKAGQEMKAIEVRRDGTSALPRRHR